MSKVGEGTPSRSVPMEGQTMDVCASVSRCRKCARRSRSTSSGCMPVAGQAKGDCRSGQGRLQVKIYRLKRQVPIQAVVNHDPIALGRFWGLERDWEASNEDGRRHGVRRDSHHQSGCSIPSTKRGSLDANTLRLFRLPHVQGLDLQRRGAMWGGSQSRDRGMRVRAILGE